MSGSVRIMAHMVAWYPDQAGSREVARGLRDGGCSYLEVQFPFSDPTADGPDIQRACSRALEAGFTVTEGMRLLGEVAADPRAPVFVMSYANLVFTRGVDRFLAECAERGARGIIVPDLPPDCDEGLYASAARIGLAAAPVLSPSMREERLARVEELGCEFVYATLRTGTTGPVTRIDSAALAFLRRIGRLAGARPVKILGGFGVSTRGQVEALAPHVHAVIVGSALVRAIAGSVDPYAAARDAVRGLAAGSISAPPGTAHEIQANR